jgi:hypothetical protein
MGSTRTVTKSATKSSRRVHIATSPKQHPSSDRPSGIIYFWSTFGVGIIALFINNVVRWSRSADFVRSDPGSGPYPYLAILRGIEGLSCLIFVLLRTYTLVLPWLRIGAPSLDGKLILGGVLVSTLDILFAVFQPTWAMNAHGLAYGSWSRSIPLFPGPGAHKVPWTCCGTCRRDLRLLDPQYSTQEVSWHEHNG